MSAAAFQCPDSGLVVHVRHDGQVWLDSEEAEELGASQDAIDATVAWIAGFRSALARHARLQGGLCVRAFDAAIVESGGHASDLDPLTWTDELSGSEEYPR